MCRPSACSSCRTTSPPRSFLPRITTKTGAAVSDNDLRALRDELFRNGTDGRRVAESRDFLALLNVPEIFYVGDTVTVMLAAYLGDDSAVDGILADVRFDARQLTLQSVSPLNCTLESDLSLAAEGEVRLLSHSKTGGGTVFAVLTFKLADDLEGEQVGLVLTGAWRPTTASAAVRPSARILARGAQAHGRRVVRAALPQRAGFRPAVLYDVLLPRTSRGWRSRADYAQAKKAYIGETTVERGSPHNLGHLYR